MSSEIPISADKLDEIIEKCLRIASSSYGPSCPGFLMPYEYTVAKYSKFFQRALKNAYMENGKAVINIADIDGEIDKDVLLFKENVMNTYCSYFRFQCKLLGKYDTEREKNNISKKVFELLS